MRRQLTLALLLAAPGALARGSWSGSLHAAYSTASGDTPAPPGLHGSWGVLGQGFRQFTPLLGLGVELGYTRYAVGRIEYAFAEGAPPTAEERVHTMLQLALALRLRATDGDVRPRLSLSLGAYPTYVSGEHWGYYFNTATRQWAPDYWRFGGNDGGGPGVGLTLGVDVLPWRSRHALSAEVRVQTIAARGPFDSRGSTWVQVGLGYTFW